MTGILFDEDSDEYAVQADASEHHLTSDDSFVDTASVSIQPAMYGPASVDGKKVMVGPLAIRISNCGPRSGAAIPGSCNGSGIIQASDDARLHCFEMPVLKTGDVGQCTGLGTTPKEDPIIINCSVCIGKSLQKQAAAKRSSATPIRATSESEGKAAKDKIFHIRLQDEDGRPIPAAEFIAESLDGNERFNGKLNENGEAEFPLNAEKCNVRYPEYDASLDRHLPYGWMPLNGSVLSRENEHDCSFKVPVEPNDLETLTIQESDYAFLFETAAETAQALGSSAFGSELRLRGKVLMRIAGTDFYFYIPPEKRTSAKGNLVTNTTKLVVQSKANPKNVWRLDYDIIPDKTLKKAARNGRNLQTADLEKLSGRKLWHHNQKGLSKVLDVTNHELAKGAKSLGKSVTVFKLAGRSLFFLGIADAGWEIYHAENKPLEATVQTVGLGAAAAGGAIGCQLGTPVGAGIGALFAGAGAIPGAAIGCGLGGLVVGGVSYFYGTKGVRFLYEKSFTKLQAEEYEALEHP